MKKIMILILSLSALTMLKAETINWGSKYSQFITMSKKDKLEWFDFTKKMKTEKIDLIKTHNAEWFDYGIANVKQWENADITTKNDKDKVFHEQLKKAIEIRKKHAQDWKKYCDDIQKEGKAIHDKQQEEIKSFEKSLVPRKEKLTKEES